MQFVEFERHDGQKVWLNPAEVVVIAISTRAVKGGVTDVLTNLGGVAIAVKGTIADTAKKLNAGLKA